MINFKEQSSTFKRKKWQKEIVMLISTLNTEINSMKSNHRVNLQNKIKDTKQKQSLIRQSVESLKEITESNEIFQIIEYNCENKEFSNFP